HPPVKPPSCHRDDRGVTSPRASGGQEWACRRSHRTGVVTALTEWLEEIGDAVVPSVVESEHDAGSNPIAQLLSAEPGTLVVRVDEVTLTIGPEFRRAPLCRCDLCGDGIVVRGDPEEGWWVQSATIAILTECEVPICDILGDD